MTDPSLPCPISLSEAIHSRRSARSYEPTTVDDTTIRVLEMAVQAPSAMNRQPWGFSVVQDAARLRRYSDLAKQMLLAVTSGDAKAGRYAAMLSDPEFNIFYDAKTLVVVSVDAPDAYADADCWLCAETCSSPRGPAAWGPAASASRSACSTRPRSSASSGWPRAVGWSRRSSSASLAGRHPRCHACLPAIPSLAPLSACRCEIDCDSLRSRPCPQPRSPRGPRPRRHGQ